MNYKKVTLLGIILLSLSFCLQAEDNLLETQKTSILESDKEGEEKINNLFDLAIRHALINPLESIELLDETQKTFQIDSTNICLYAQLESHYGVVYYYLMEYNIALDYFYKAFSLQENNCNEEDIAFSLNAIGNVFLGSAEYSKAIEYYEKSLEIKKKLNRKNIGTGTIGNMGTAYTYMGNYAKADSCFREVLAILLEQDKEDYYNLATVHHNIGLLYKNQKEYDKSLKSYLEALDYVEKDNQKSWLHLYILCSITETYILQHNYETAKTYLDITLKELDELKSDDLLMFAYRNAAFYYAALGNLDRNIEYFNKYNEVKDLVFSEEKQRKLIESQVKYETEQTAKENALQKLEIEKGRQIQIFLIVILLVLILLVSIFFFIYKNRLNKTREKEILSATIKTEERERSRFAEELHDSLGAILSTMRIYTDIIDTLLGKKNYDEEVSNNFVTLNSLLNDAITTTKEVSNGLIPNVLTSFGLIDSLYSYFNKVNNTNTIKIDFEVDERIDRFEENEEIAYFRIISELLNNTLKHAEAENVTIKIGIKKDKMFIHYIDDGIGFNYKSAQNKEGTMGLQNITSRAVSIGAEYQIKTSPSKGFDFYLTKLLN